MRFSSSRSAERHRPLAGVLRPRWRTGSNGPAARDRTGEHRGPFDVAVGAVGRPARDGRRSGPSRSGGAVARPARVNRHSSRHLLYAGGQPVAGLGRRGLGLAGRAAAWAVDVATSPVRSLLGRALVVLVGRPWPGSGRAPCAPAGRWPPPRSGLPSPAGPAPSAGSRRTGRRSGRSRRRCPSSSISIFSTSAIFWRTKCSFSAAAVLFSTSCSSSRGRPRICSSHMPAFRISMTLRASVLRAWRRSRSCGSSQFAAPAELFQHLLPGRSAAGAYSSRRSRTRLHQLGERVRRC